MIVHKVMKDVNQKCHWPECKNEMTMCIETEKNGLNEYVCDYHGIIVMALNNPNLVIRISEDGRSIVL